MSEIRQHGRDLIEAARIERTPSVRDRERIFAALMAGAALSTAATSAVGAPSLLAKLTSGVGKWWLLGGFCSAVAGGSYLASQGTATSATERGPSLAPRSATASPANVTRAPTALAELAPPAAEATMPAASAIARAASAKRESAAPDLELELSQLHAAHAAYRSARPEQALSLIAQHRRRFPQSQLGVERSTLEVLSLCRLGRQRQAQQLADRLRSTATGSAALSGLEGSCVAAAAAK